MVQTLTLSKGKLADFQACRRRFQLRYLLQLPWPAMPFEGQDVEALRLGRRFHQVLHRHFIGLPVLDEIQSEPKLRRWWEHFTDNGPALPPGKRFPELSLTVPIGQHRLVGRFDLLVLGPKKALIVDWKTESRPRVEARLRGELQTRIYLALVAESGSALSIGPALDRPIKPEHISITFWYAGASPPALTIDYDRDRHTENWTMLKALVAEIEDQMALDGPWPMTGDWSRCERCPFQIYCKRQTGVLNLVDWEPEESASPLERDYS
jgi:hypothetical protein